MTTRHRARTRVLPAPRGTGIPNLAELRELYAQDPHRLTPGVEPEILAADFPASPQRDLTHMEVWVLMREGCSAIELAAHAGVSEEVARGMMAETLAAVERFVAPLPPEAA